MSGTRDSRSVAALYDRWAATYDTDANRTRDLAGVVLRAECADVAGGDVLELGCGTGRNTGWLAERARRVVALDFSEGMLSQARAAVRSERVRFVRHDIRSPLPLAPESADLVVFTLVLEHVEAVAPVFDECARVLRPGGRLFLCELHPYRQYAGVKAHFSEPGMDEPIAIPAYVHGVSEFVNAGLGAGLRLAHMGEWRDEADEAGGGRPRLLSLLFERSRGRHRSR